MLGERVGKQEPIHSLIQRQPEPTNRATRVITPFRIMYIMLNLGRYYLGLLKLVLASILPLRGSKDKASIDACVST